MKRRYFIILLLASFSINIYAQFNAYIPFPSSNAFWAESTWWEVLCGGKNVNMSKDFDYHITGDTIIKGNNYHKLSISGGEEWAACSQSPADISQKYDSVIGCFRENSKRIYYCCFNKGIYDTLLYDFNLKAGDTLPDTYINSRKQKDIVYKTDSILVGNRYRKEYIISHNSLIAFATLIEGIGSTRGLLEPLTMSFEAGAKLNCFKQNNILIYPHLNDSCPLFNVGSSPTLLKVYHDKSDKMLTITFQLLAGQYNGVLRLYNVRGDFIGIKDVDSTSSPIVEDVSNLSNGIYYYVLSVKNRVIGTNKFVILQ